MTTLRNQAVLEEPDAGNLHVRICGGPAAEIVRRWPTPTTGRDRAQHGLVDGIIELRKIVQRSRLAGYFAHAGDIHPA